MHRILLALLLSSGCQSTKEWNDKLDQADERRQLAKEILGTAKAFGRQICACRDDACAQKVEDRFHGWRERTKAELDEVETRQGKKVTADKDAIDRAFADYETCAIRFAIGRPPKG